MEGIGLGWGIFFMWRLTRRRYETHVQESMLGRSYNERLVVAHRVRLGVGIHSEWSMVSINMVQWERENHFSKLYNEIWRELPRKTRGFYHPVK